ncbi:MAG: hypothetical protein SWZ49_28665 [Cyanobacteriota bacterium]|nr:hypothetical protein [Cyanobacteriota bacterium]
MANNRKIRIIAAIVLALLMILLSGTAVAQSKISNRDIIHFGSDITIEENEVVNDVTAIAGSVIVSNDGHVTGDAVAVGGDVRLKAGAKVDGDATAVGGEIFQEEGVTIGGDAVTITEENGGIIQGLRRWGFWGLLGRIYLINATFYALLMLSVAIIGIVLMLLVPSFLHSIAETINQKPLLSIGSGLGGFVTFLILVILTSGSLLGSILIPVATLALGFAKLLGINAICLFIGEKVSRNQNYSIPQLLVGIVVMGVISLIPVFGGMVFLILTIFGFGGVLASPWVMEKLKDLRHKEPVLSISEEINEHKQQVL